MHIKRIKVSGIKGFFGPRNVDLSLPVPEGRGSWTVLAGRNASGKTTLLRAIALGVSGPAVSLGFESFRRWISQGLQEGRVDIELIPSREDRFSEVVAHRISPLTASLRWRQGPQDEDADLEPSLMGDSNGATQGPWDPQTSGWFIAGYGPFRRLSGSALEADRYTTRAATSRLATLFFEGAALPEGVRWLIDLHLRALEGRPGVEELLAFVVDLLNDGLLPDGFHVDHIDSDGLWIGHDGVSLALQELSDGYRAVVALVLDMVRQLDHVYGDGRSAKLAGKLAYRREHLSAEGDSPRILAPGVILIDEVDAHLHVTWQKKIGLWLKAHFPNIQFIVTSHSPYICQSADPGGLIRLSGPGEQRGPEVVDDDLYQRIIYGSGDDALLSDLFGLDSVYSTEAEQQRRRLVILERSVLRGHATDAEIEEYKHLRELLSSSLLARVDEVSARFTQPS
ncbi:AAA family ATPase [Nonomuraea sp. NPDC050547]|uniref:AAA family ATPase n=1 Tax=unclassified Nonomuraea TaxID=2593643 RepID=UPI00379F25E9